MSEYLGERTLVTYPYPYAYPYPNQGYLGERIPKLELGQSADEGAELIVLGRGQRWSIALGVRLVRG